MRSTTPDIADRETATVLPIPGEAHGRRARVRLQDLPKDFDLGVIRIPTAKAHVLLVGPAILEFAHSHTHLEQFSAKPKHRGRRVETEPDVHTVGE